LPPIFRYPVPSGGPGRVATGLPAGYHLRHRDAGHRGQAWPDRRHVEHQDDQGRVVAIVAVARTAVLQQIKELHGGEAVNLIGPAGLNRLD